VFASRAFTAKLPVLILSPAAWFVPIYFVRGDERKRWEGGRKEEGREGRRGKGRRKLEVEGGGEREERGVQRRNALPGRGRAGLSASSSSPSSSSPPLENFSDEELFCFFFGLAVRM
jgi:hypothetical protein